MVSLDPEVSLAAPLICLKKAMDDREFIDKGKKRILKDVLDKEVNVASKNKTQLHLEEVGLAFYSEAQT